MSHGNRNPENRGRLLGINGQMFSGKSTAAKVLVEKGWEIVKFSGPLKRITGTILSCAGHHTPEEIYSATEGALKNEWLPSIGMTPRALMQRIGSDYRSVVGLPSLWCDIAIDDANQRRSVGIDVAIDDTRFIDPEVKAIKRNGGEVWGIRRKNVAPAPVSEEERKIVKAAKARPMDSEYAENIANAFSTAFQMNMRDLWPMRSPVAFEDALSLFSGVFVDDHIVPLMTDHPVEVNLLNHVSEIVIPDEELSRVIQNDGSLLDYQHRIKVALASLNMRKPPPVQTDEMVMNASSPSP